MSTLLTFLLTIINLQNDLIQKMYILFMGPMLFSAIMIMFCAIQILIS